MQDLEQEQEQKERKERGIKELAYTLGTTGWREIILPQLAQRLTNHLSSLSVLTRPEGVNDDILRGRIDENKWFMTAFARAVSDFEAEQKAEAQSALDAEPAQMQGPYSTPDAV